MSFVKYLAGVGRHPARKDIMETEILPQLHTLEVIAQRTSLSRSAIYRELKSGRLHGMKIGKAIRVSESDLQRWMNALSS